MSRFFSQKYANLTPYTPGEQPQERTYLKLNTNESPFPPSPMAQSLARQAAGILQLYSDPVCRTLTKVAAETFDIAENEIIFTNSSDETLNFAFMAFCDSAHPAVFPDVTYGFYPVFAALNHIPYTQIPLCEDFTVRVEDYLGVGGTIFLANPNAPTGIALTRSQIAQIAAANPDNVVVVDEAYVDFGAESAVGLFREHPNLLVIQTFSKSRSMAGGRLGFSIADAALIRDLNTIKYSTNPYSVNRMTMAAGIGALADDAYFRKNCAEIARVRRMTAQRLRELGFRMTDSTANFLFAAHARMGGEALYLALKERGVLVRHFETPRLRDFNRITIGSEEQMETFLRILAQILEEHA